MTTPLLPVRSIAVGIAAAVLLLTGCGDGRARSEPDRAVRNAGAPRSGELACTASGAYVAGIVFEAVEGAERIVANGFPVYATTGPGSMASPGSGFSTNLAPALVSGSNDVVFAVAPAVHLRGGTEAVGGPGDVPETGPTRFRAWVCGPDGAVLGEAASAASDSAFAAWRAAFEGRWPRWQAMEDSLYAARPALADSAAAAMGRDRVAAAVGVSAALDSARAWAAAHPVAVSVTFERPADPGGAAADGLPSWDAVLREAPVIAAADSARLRAFAVGLRDLMAAEDSLALLAAHMPSVEQRYAIYVAPGPKQDYLQTVRGQVVVDGAVLDWDVEELELQRWADGRVWEITRPGGLFMTPVVQGARRGRDKAYVGEVDGELRVVW